MKRYKLVNRVNEYADSMCGKSGFPEGCYDVIGWDRQGNYEDDFAVVAKDEDRQYWAAEGGGCSCGGSVALGGPFKSLVEAIGFLSEHYREALGEDV